MNIEIISSLVTLTGVCIAGVNVIVEVLKAFWLEGEENYPKLVLIVSEAMAFMVVYAYCTIAKVSFTPMLFMGALTAGFFISYGAMFGYEKLYGTLLKKIEEIFKGDRDDRRTN